MWSDDDPVRRMVEVRDDQGPRDAAINYAEQYETGEATLLVCEYRPHETKGARWRVEPVTTYRAKHPGPCPRPSHLWFAHSFAPFCAACRALAAWLDRPRNRPRGEP